MTARTVPVSAFLAIVLFMTACSADTSPWNDEACWDGTLSQAEYAERCDIFADLDCSDKNMPQWEWMEYCYSPIEEDHAAIEQDEPQISVPNLVGLTHKEIQSWAMQNSLYFLVSFNTEVRYEYSAACRAAQSGVALSQTPTAGSIRTIKSGRRVPISVGLDC